MIAMLTCPIKMHIKNYGRGIHPITIATIFISSCQWLDVASCYIIKKTSNEIWSLCVTNRQESYPTFQWKEIH